MQLKSCLNDEKITEFSKDVTRNGLKDKVSLSTRRLYAGNTHPFYATLPYTNNLITKQHDFMQGKYTNTRFVLVGALTRLIGRGNIAVT